jgi:hypothetical protein
MDHLRRRIHRVIADSASVFVFVGVLMASYLVVGGGVAAAEQPQEKRFTARIISEIGIDNPKQGSEMWCYSAGGEPTFVFAKHKMLFRYDVSGKLLFKYEANWLDDVTDPRGAIGSFSCSRDGKTLWFVNDGNTRLAIHTAESGLSEYEASLPTRNFDESTVMSPDGGTFFLSSAPSLLSGKDVLRDRRVVQVGKANAHWTDDVIFLGAIDDRRFRMLRTSDLSAIGELQFELKKRIYIWNIFKDGTNYFAEISKDRSEQPSRLRINDPRLRPSATAGKPGNAAISPQPDRFRVERYNRRSDDRHSLLDSILISRKSHRERIDLSNITDPIFWIEVSPDGRFILARREFEVAYTVFGNPAKEWFNHIVVLEIER